MYSKFVKSCSIILTVALLINLLPMQVLGAGESTPLTQPETVISSDIPDDEVIHSGNATIVGEVVDKRTEFSKEYKLSNGLHMTAVYPRAVHYNSNGSWEEIDNTLKAVGSGANATYTNTAGSWAVSFPQTLTKAKTVSVSKGGYTLRFGMAGELRSVSSGVIGGEIATMSTTQMGDVGETYVVSAAQNSTAQIHQAPAVLTVEDIEYAELISRKTDARVSYQNVYHNTNVIYDLLSTEIKESIVLKAFDASLRGYKYILNTGTLVPCLNDDNSIDLYDAGMNNIIFTMPAPFMIDNAGEYCGDVGVTLTGSNGTYTLSYLLPISWLVEDTRSWPVVLDPVITEHSSQENIQDQTVTEEQVPNPSTGVLQLGWREDWGTMRFFMKFDEIPELKSADVVVHAQIGLYKAQTSNTTVPVTVHKVLGDWSENTITWSNKPAYDTTVEDHYPSKTIGMHYWEVTDIVRGWYETGNNYGMMFKVIDDYENLTSNNFRQYYSPDYSAHPSDYGLYPGLWVTFRNANGVESYWDYTANSAGRAGTGYVNNYSGNLSWIHNDIGFAGNRMPVSINHVYNTNDIGENPFGLGYGWRTNFNQTAGVWPEDNSYYFWEDGDGTTHYFLWSEADGVYKDEDGLDLDLSVAGGEITITDKNGNKSFFDGYGRLYKIENNQQTKSSITITYDYTSKRISRITDGVGRKYNFDYVDDLLNKISYTGKGETDISYVTFGYSGANLTSITDKDGGSSIFTYGANNLLLEAKDVEGYELRYSYSNGWPKRVVGVYEFSEKGAPVDAVPGGYMTIAYAHNQTTFTDHNGQVKILQFNDWGNLIAAQDDEGRAQYLQYERSKYTENSSSKANKMSLSSKMQNTVTNWFENSSFETATMWASNGPTLTVSQSNTYAYVGNYSMKLQRNVADGVEGAYSYQYSVAPGETVTFSAYIKTVGADVTIAIERNTNYTIFWGDTAPADKEWERYQISYSNTSAGVENIHCYFFVGGAGTVYIDGVQLEATPTASRYNIIENGDFRFGANSWLMSNYCDSNETCITAENPNAPQLNSTAFQIVGDPTHKLRIRQEVPVSGVAGDTYVLAGWAKGDGVPLVDKDSNHRTFTVRGTFMSLEGDPEEFNFDFNPDADGDCWQYCAGAMVATKPFSGIKIQVLYDFGANTVYFDGIQLFKESFGTTYTYDDDGKVVSVVDLQNETTTYEYTDNDLTRIIDSNGVLTYTYDTHHNVLSATTATGIVYQFTYDTYGNNTEVRVVNGDKYISSSATYVNEGNYLHTTKDDLENVTTYEYNGDTGVLEWVQYPNDTANSRTTYTYDELYRIASSTAAVSGLSGGTNLTASYTYDGDLLTDIQTASTNYEFYYGNFDVRTGVKIGDNWLALYEYTDDQNRDLSAIEYGNRQINTYRYDEERRLIKEIFDNGSTVSYEYDNTGALSTVTDSATGRKTTYYYDLLGRIGKYKEVGSNYEHSVAYTYDNRNNLSQLVESINGVGHTTQYTYDGENRLIGIDHGSVNENISYDGYGRLDSTSLQSTGSTVMQAQFQYRTPSETSSSTQINQITVSGGTDYLEFLYNYDSNGNIVNYRVVGPESMGGIIPWTNGKVVLEDVYYHYDSANQLIREDNVRKNSTTFWLYDNAGNIVDVRNMSYRPPAQTVFPGAGEGDPFYTYGDADWGDLLTAYKGKTITYDGIGNPLSDGTWTYTWQNGRELASMSKSSITWNYTYDANGMRTSRSNGTKTYNYVYNGSQLTQMTVGNDTLYFTYGALGPTTVTWNGTTYYYALNGQGDVTGIFDGNGNLVVLYNWDNAWGYNPAPEGTMAATLGTLNPLRYRGYVYDTETGLYYVSSRYYDPEIGRWINADNQLSTGSDLTGINLFAYCGNNPVNRIDPDGHAWKDVKNWFSNTWNNIKKTAKQIVETVKEKVYTTYYNATKWHFEDREKKNGTHPTYSEVNDRNSGWNLLPESQSIYHDNGVGKSELKYITDDGREAVFDGDTLEPVTDPKYIATYNYCPLYQMPSTGAGVLDYVKLAGSGVGHFFADMVPYYLTGNSNTREQFESKVFLFD